MSRETKLKIECCDLYNKLKDKSEMIDYLYISKVQIAELQQQLEEKDKSIQGLLEYQEILVDNSSYQMFLDQQEQLHTQPREIVEKIRTTCEKEKGDNDLAFGSYVKVVDIDKVLQKTLKEYEEKNDG